MTQIQIESFKDVKSSIQNVDFLFSHRCTPPRSQLQSITSYRSNNPNLDVVMLICLFYTVADFSQIILINCWPNFMITKKKIPENSQTYSAVKLSIILALPETVLACTIYECINNLILTILALKNESIKDDRHRPPS